MSYFWFELFFAIFLGILAYYAYFKLYISKYWKNHNVFHAEPIFIVGNTYNASITKNLWEVINDFYFKWKEKKLIGIWSFSSPVLVPTDLTIIKNILIKDFDHFQNHGPLPNIDREPLAGKF